MDKTEHHGLLSHYLTFWKHLEMITLNKNILVGIAGPSCSGKTTISQLIVEAREYTLVRQELYWKDPIRFPIINGLKNWELPQNLKFDMLHKNLSDLKNNVVTDVPEWKGIHLIGLREIKPSSVIIVEGFLLFYDRSVRDLLDFKIYLDIPNSLSIERRLLRYKRNADNRKRVDTSRKIDYYKYALEVYCKNGLPTKKFADLVLDGTKPIQENLGKILSKIDELKNKKPI